MTTVHCRRVTFGYPGADHNVFEHLDLTIDTGWRAALVGRNGRGKTTLLRLLAGELMPDAGEIQQRPATRHFPCVPEDPSLPAVAVAKDAIGPFRRWEREMASLLERGDERSLARYGLLQARYHDAGGYAVDAGIERELDALGLDPELRNRPFAELSGGERTRVLLASLFADGDAPGHRYALIDEPTNHLDRPGRARLAGYLATKPGFLLVSHDRAFLDAACDHVVALNADDVTVERGSFSAWRKRFKAERARLAAKNVELKRQIATFEETARARRSGALKRESDKAAHTDKGFIGHRAARQMKRALVAENRAKKAAAERRETLTNFEKERDLKLGDAGQPGTVRPLLIANDLSLVRGGRCLFAHLSFRVAPADRIAVVGPNGAGKTTLLDQIAGAGHPMTGSLTRPAHVRIGRVFQHPLWSAGSLRRHLAAAGIDETRFRQVMDALGVRGAELDQPLEALSQGQLKKVDLARCFFGGADLLLWDEPLNYIDVDARERIEQVVLEDEPTLVFVEHDAAFVDRVATEVIDLARFEG